MATRVPTDASDQLVYTFSETDAPFANSGSGGTANLTKTGTVVSNQPGFIGLKSVRFPGDSITQPNYLKSADSIAEFGYPITLSCWTMGIELYYWGGIYGAYGGMIIKQLTTGVWTYPPPAANAAIGLRSREYSRDGFQVGLKTVGDSTTNWWSLLGFPLREWSWNHLGVVYDGAYLKAYYNGREVLSTAKTGAIDYGNHGQWVFGATPGSEKNFNGYEITNCGLTGHMTDVRIANVARPASWFSDVWRYGWVAVGGVQPLLPPIVIPVEE